MREEFHHLREGKHGARSPEQAIAIGLSKARRAGVALEAPKAGRGSEKIRKHAKRDLALGPSRHAETSPRRSQATTKALKRESGSTASLAAISRQTRSAAKRRRHLSLRKAAWKAVRTKRKAGRRRAARKAARTRRRNR